MSFCISGLDPAPFRHLYGLGEAALARAGVRRMMTDQPHAFPDRIGLRDAEPGESVLLLNYMHQPADTPYRASHAIFVREGAEKAETMTGEVPESLRRRTISLRAFDAAGDLIDADLAEGTELAPLIERFLADPAVDYCHAHYARHGCYAARVDRA